MEIDITYPVRSVDFDINEGLVTLKFKNPRPSFLDKYVFKENLKRDIKLDLDEIGSFVWNNCDGKMSIKEIAEKTKTELGENIEQVETRVELFVEKMSVSKFVKLYIKR
ncbi:MAG: PqqD family protein [Bacteroidetes bacterium]|nr:PqqD family protein [Bacteroidota bacterium]